MFLLIRRFAQTVNWNSGWIIIPIAALLLFASSWMMLGFIAALGLYLCRWIAVGSPLPVTRVNFLILILLVMVAVDWVYSPAPDLAVLTGGQVMASVAIFFVLVDKIESVSDLWRGAAALAIFGILAALVAPFTVTWSPDKVYGIPFFYETVWPHLPKLTNPNILAGALAPIVPVALAFIVQGDRRGRVLGAATLVPAVGMLLLLQSRGALFALGAGLAIWITLYNRWFLPLIPIGLLVVLYINQARGGPSPAQLFYGKIGTPTGGTLIERQDMWAQSVNLIRQSPILGIGLGAYPRVAPFAAPYSPAHPGFVAPHTHNLFLQVALDTGIFGLAAFVALLGAALWSAWRAVRAGVERHLGIAILAALTIIVVHGLGDTIVWGTAKSSIVLWMLLALATGLDKARKVV